MLIFKRFCLLVGLSLFFSTNGHTLTANQRENLIKKTIVVTQLCQALKKINYDLNEKINLLAHRPDQAEVIKALQERQKEILAQLHELDTLNLHPEIIAQLEADTQEESNWLFWTLVTVVGSTAAVTLFLSSYNIETGNFEQPNTALISHNIDHIKNRIAHLTGSKKTNPSTTQTTSDPQDDQNIISNKTTHLPSDFSFLSEDRTNNENPFDFADSDNNQVSTTTKDMLAALDEIEKIDTQSKNTQKTKDKNLSKNRSLRTKKLAKKKNKTPKPQHQRPAWASSMANDALLEVVEEEQRAQNKKTKQRNPLTRSLRKQKNKPKNKKQEPTPKKKSKPTPPLIKKKSKPKKQQPGFFAQYITNPLKDFWYNLEYYDG